MRVQANRDSQPSRHHQKGAIGIFGITTLLIVILFTALAVDSARLWMEKRQLQTIADISAMEAAKGMHCNPDLSNILSKAQQGAAANGFTGDLSAAPNLLEVGSVKSVLGRRQFNADGTLRAVHVHVTKQVPSSLIAGGFFKDSTTLSADAVSLPSLSLASFGIGLTALNLDTKDSALLNQLLGQMLGSPINLSLVSYQGLANSHVTLANIIRAQGQALTVDELLNTQFTSQELLALISNAVGLETDLLPGVLNDTTSIANAAVKNTTLSLGDVLKINDNIQDAAANVDINLLSLLMSMISLSNGNNAVSVPVVVGLPGIASVNAGVTLIEPAQMVIGPPADINGVICTTVRSAQVRASVAVLVNIPLLARVDLKLNVEVESGSASLNTIEAKGNATELSFGTESSLVTTTLTNSTGTGSASISTLNGLVKLAEIGLNLAPFPANAKVIDTQVNWPVAQNLPQTVTVNNGLSVSFEQLLSQPSAITVNVLGINLPVIGTVVSTIIRPLLVQLSITLLDPLLKVLGIRLNNMDIIIEDVSLGNPAPLVM